MTEQIKSFLDGVISTNLEPLHEKFGEPPKMVFFQWPWSIAKKGSEYIQNHMSAVTSLTSAGKAIINSPDGASILASIGSKPTDSSNTNKVLNKGIFSDALNSVKADQLLRTIFIGWAGGTQAGIFGGAGGAGVAYDILDQSQMSAVSYGIFNLGIGAQVVNGLLIGAMTRPPGNWKSSTCAFEFGAALVGISVFFSVIMTDKDLGLIGFTLNVSLGIGLSSATGYGSISSNKL